MTTLNFFLLLALIGAVISFFFVIRFVRRKVENMDGFYGVHESGDETIPLSP